MKNILVISLFGDIELVHSRLSNIYKYSSSLVDKVITSDFDHSKKAYKGRSLLNFVEYIHVSSYSKNLSFARIVSHMIFAYRLNKYLKSVSSKPATIYCAMPSSTSAYICGKYCKKNNIRFVIDVVDLWPDSLIPVLGIKGKLMKAILYPWKYITIQAYKMADVILGESKFYVDVARKYNPLAKTCTLYLGIDQDMIDSLLATSTISLYKSKTEIWLCYGGNLGTSYDFETLIKGVSILNGKYSYKLLFVGDGVYRDKIEDWISLYKVNAEIVGFVNYCDYLKYLSYCDIAINIFRENTMVVHSYKFNDYVATNCFVLNSLKGETADMIDNYHIGLNFDFEVNTIDKVLLECCLNWNIYKEWKHNNKKLITEILDKKSIYSQMPQILSASRKL